MLKYIPLDCKSILEVGCGYGNFGEQLTHRCEVWGVEPNKEAADIAKNKLHNVVNGFFNDKLDFAKKFDVLVFNDVLEHMINPWEVLEFSKTLLNNDGIIVSSIPNFLYYHEFLPFIIHQDFKYNKQGGVFDTTHLRFFTRKSIIRLFEETGYHVNVIEGIHGSNSIRLKFYQYLSFNYFKDLKYMQFAVQAKMR